jgi:hypothetical protein
VSRSPRDLGLRLVAISLVMGTAVSIPLSASARVRFTRGALGARDAAILLLAAVAVAACWIPAARAARMNPLAPRGTSRRSRRGWGGIDSTTMIRALCGVWRTE